MRNLVIASTNGRLERTSQGPSMHRTRAPERHIMPPRLLARGLALVFSILPLACSRSNPPAQNAAGDQEQTSATAPAPTTTAPIFANKVWKVSRSSGVEPGTIYVFLSDSTLLITSSHGTPALGRWTYVGDTLTLIEEGIPYRARVTKLDPNELSLRLAERGTPLEITLVPHTPPTPESPAGTAGSDGGAAPQTLLGTTWVLVDFGGSEPLDGVQVTLEFPETGKVAGRGSCNRFFGTIQVSGDTIAFSPLGSTRMACPDALMKQETKYLQALQKAVRYKIDGSSLMIFVKDMDKPLRFTRH